MVEVYKSSPVDLLAFVYRHKQPLSTDFFRRWNLLLTLERAFYNARNHQLEAMSDTNSPRRPQTPPPWIEPQYYPPWTESVDTRFIWPVVPVTDYLYYKPCNADVKNTWDSTVIGADMPVFREGTPDPNITDEQRRDADRASGDDDPDTHLKRVTQEFFKAHVFTCSDVDLGTKATSWEVQVDDRFKPDPEMCLRGLIARVDLRYSSHALWRNNMYKLYVLFCLVPELGGTHITPLDVDFESTRFNEEGWDEALEVDLNCESRMLIVVDCGGKLMIVVKKIWNAVIDYYHSERGSGMQTKYVVPLLYRNPDIIGSEVERIGLREVDLTPWLQKDQKYAL
jgi:hypothetical protein